MTSIQNAPDGEQLSSWGGAVVQRPNAADMGPLVVRTANSIYEALEKPPFPYVSLLGRDGGDWPSDSYGLRLDFGNRSTQEGTNGGFTWLAVFRPTRGRIDQQTIFDFDGVHRIVRNGTGTQFVYEYRATEEDSYVFPFFTELNGTDAFDVVGVRIGARLGWWTGGRLVAMNTPPGAAPPFQNRSYAKTYVGGSTSGAPFMSMDIIEMMWYDRPLSDAEMTSKAQELQSKVPT
jgi:hypothetical protein